MSVAGDGEWDGERVREHKAGSTFLASEGSEDEGDWHWSSGQREGERGSAKEELASTTRLALNTLVTTVPAWKLPQCSHSKM